MLSDFNIDKFKKLKPPSDNSFDTSQEIKQLQKTPMNENFVNRYDNGEKVFSDIVGKDPLIGTGKKPKGSGRRLYTDENPKDTVSIKFATVADARKTIAKVMKINKPYARKVQILTVLEQRAKVMGKMEQARLAKSAKARLKRQKKNV